VRPILELLASEIPVHGLAHITGDGLLNLLRLNPEVGYAIDDPPPPNRIFELIRAAGHLSAAEMYEAFNMGIGFCCVVPASAADGALALLRAHHRSTRRIGTVTAERGTVRVAPAGIVGRREGFTGG
jgi:phosphoribosylformylglycinamidine cyclo-ligase